MKMEYTKPVVEEQKFAVVDVITTSPAGAIDNEDGEDD